MSEEIKKPGAELNGAELANVSGAGDNDPLAEYAEICCRWCGLSKVNYICDGGGKSVLLNYMRKHGKIDYLDCPYRKQGPSNFKPIQFN